MVLGFKRVKLTGPIATSKFQPRPERRLKKHPLQRLLSKKISLNLLPLRLIKQSLNLSSLRRIKLLQPQNLLSAAPKSLNFFPLRLIKQSLNLSPLRRIKLLQPQNLLSAIKLLQPQKTRKQTNELRLTILLTRSFQKATTPLSFQRDFRTTRKQLKTKSFSCLLVLILKSCGRLLSKSLLSKSFGDHHHHSHQIKSISPFHSLQSLR